MGQTQGANAAKPRQSRVRVLGRSAVLRLLRRASWTIGTGLLQLPSWRLARAVTEQQPAGRRLDRARSVDSIGADRQYLTMRAGVLSPSTLQLRAERRQRSTRGVMADALRAGRGRDHQRARASVRAVRADVTGWSAQRHARHPSVHRRDGWRGTLYRDERACAE